MNESIEVSIEAFSCTRIDELAIVKLGEHGFQVTTDLETKEKFLALLATVEESPSIKGLALLNTTDYPGDESYRAFLDSIMGGGDQSRRASGVLAHRYGNAVSQLAVRLSEFSKPIVAGMVGNITGEQLGLVLPCDFRFATPGVTFTFPNVALGFPPTGVLVFYLLSFLGPAKTTEILYSTESLPVSEALELGLLTSIVAEDQLEKCCIDQLKRLSNLPALALAATRRLMQPDPVELKRFLDRSQETIWVTLFKMGKVSR
jgi:enoyl-CoA hydratase/carnithine racemase